MKLDCIDQYYFDKHHKGLLGREHLGSNWPSSKIDDFIRSIQELKTIDNVLMDEDDSIYGSSDYDLIYESSQGLLLDKDIGFFPHVTRSNVGMYNVDEIYYVTRAYQTRHGNGPMTNEHLELKIKENVYETNRSNKWQGEFRKTILDLDLLKYALSCTPNSPYFLKNRKLVITCLDQVEGNWKLTLDGNLLELATEEDFVNTLRTILNIDEVIRFRSDETPS